MRKGIGRNAGHHVPEFCQVAGGKGVLSPKCRTECVDVAQSAGVLLSVQLTRDSQECWAIEEILRIIDLSYFSDTTFYLFLACDDTRNVVQEALCRSLFLCTQCYPQKVDEEKGLYKPWGSAVL